MACLLLLAGAAGAQDNDRQYERLVAEAYAVYWDRSEEMTEAIRIDRAYELFGQAALLDQSRWEAFFGRGLNRCKAILFARGRTAEALASARAQGATARQLAAIHRETSLWIQARLDEAWQEFRKAEIRMRKRGDPQPNRIRFASAAMKFANREYLKAKGGASGAIDDFKALIERDFLPEQCKEHIALSYFDLAYMTFVDEEFPKAQEYWDEALKWTSKPRLRQVIYTNKAGAFEFDNEYARAEKILREQIREEPYRPVHHKNLGLVLGYQNRLKEALVHYEKARELCARIRAPYRFGMLHGNAWLRAAVIHGKLLEQEGDLRLSWRLFWEYRDLLGDDYNFCFAFGDFCASLGEYELARVFLERARAMQPHCPAPYQLLVQIAPRTAGTREDVKERIAETRAAYEAARKKYNERKESTVVQRLCAGLRDRGDAAATARAAPRIDPDPLAEFGPEDPPGWVVEAAAKRRPFEPYRPDPGAASAPSGPDAPAGGGGGARTWPLAASVAAAALVLAAGALLFFRRHARTA